MATQYKIEYLPGYSPTEQKDYSEERLNELGAKGWVVVWAHPEFKAVLLSRTTDRNADPITPDEIARRGFTEEAYRLTQPDSPHRYPPMPSIRSLAEHPLLEPRPVRDNPQA